jgi:Ca-activated chloride channel family protein
MNWYFEYPYAFILIALYLVCKLLCKKNIEEIFFSNAYILERIVQKRRDFKTILEFLTLLFLVFALANPITKEQLSKNKALGYEIVLSIDASDSMRADNRFNITKEIVEKFIEKRIFDSIALTLFAQDVYIAVPFTYDKKPLKDILKYIELGVAGSVGTALNEALYVSSNLFKDIKNPSKILILLTDGINTKDNIPLDVAIANAKKQNIKVYTIAIGKEGEYNKEALELIAKETNAEFFETSNPSQLMQIYDSIDNLEKSKIETSTLTKTKYYFQYPLFLSLIFLIILIFINREQK